MKENKGRHNRKQRFYSEMWGTLMELCENLVKLSMCYDLMETVFIKRWVSLER